ncbi:MAG: hypothetical protein HFJ25_01230 [Clostridia bacterium]|nr:hypothetical protein [Clostridia bacterium]
MKKILTFVLPIFIMIAVAIICVGFYMIFTNKLPKIQRVNKTSQSVQENNDNVVILSKKELPKLDAQVSLRPLMTEVVKNFTQDNSVSIDYSENNNKIYDRLINGEVDIIFAISPTSDVLTRAKAMGVEFELIPIAKEGFVFYVNYNNPVSSLKVSDIQNIYSGQVSNWSQLGGENENITAFQRTENSLNQEEMISLVMRNLEMVNPPKCIFKDKKFGEISDLIASYDNSKSAIGYSYYYDTKVLYNIDNNFDNTVKLLKINDIAPNYENISNGSYPLQTSYYLVRNKSNNDENVQIFANNMLSERGQKIVKEAGYIDN